ncbi:MAG: IucA/IucC family C-terminal-domain containing protein [Actinomycetota bacterium]
MTAADGEATASRADGVVDELLGTVGYLRITAADDPEAADREWLRCADLLERTDWLAELVRESKPARGTDDDGVAMSLFMQGYAFRIASAAIGAFVISGDVLDVDPATTSVALGGHRPNAVRLDRPTLVTAGGDVAVLHDVLVEDHLAPLVDACRSATRIGERLLWSNVASSCAASFGAFVDPRPDGRDRLREIAEVFATTGRPELREAGRLVRLGDGPRWVWERTACCLYYQTDGALGADGERRKCGDCSLFTAAERSARYAELIGQD